MTTAESVRSLKKRASPDDMREGIRDAVKAYRSTGTYVGATEFYARAARGLSVSPAWMRHFIDQLSDADRAQLGIPAKRELGSKSVKWPLPR